ncbi:membrane protein [Tamlana sedimentorum]|uniref:Membrane protein n=1 Tax=Neotamlana sedimentorum TaxID=1435349 RepID=A0A0D7W691_9FLAO|nr:membrane protein [Tamlana sedimentorum]
MNEFLIKYYYIITFSVESLAAVTGLILYKKYKLTSAKYFIWFLCYLTICDTLAYYPLLIKHGYLSFLRNTRFFSNFWWSTLFWHIGAILFFTFYYRKILTYKTFKIVLKYAGYLFLAFCFIYVSLNFEDYFVRFFPVISVFGALIIFMCVMFYFIEMLQSNNILTFYKNLNFYITAISFIWWLIITATVFYEIYNSNNDWNFIFLRWQIYMFANAIMYFGFTFALIYCRPEAKGWLKE